MIAAAYMAYDCSSNVKCIAALLDDSFLQGNPTIQVKQYDGESWIRLGEDNGAARHLLLHGRANQK